jgi:hypothetical protein
LLLIVELSAVTIKFADDRRQAENAFVEVQRVDTPLMRIRIV